ncbi:MAG TPA: S41 family peptidase [Anaeromyxobacteraceae bacterium]|nr:S41 family peptidase [Anaeromyxobacteraceae bacterium]
MPATTRPARSLRPLALPLTLALAALACGGNDGFQASSPLANRCAAPRSGTDPFTGQRYPDARGTLDDEKRWLKSYMDALYLWYSEIPAVDPAAYESITGTNGYFEALKTKAVTASGKPKDAFSFTLDTSSWEAQSVAGVEAGYGIRWVLLANRPPRDIVVAQIEPGSPAAKAGVVRGLHVATVDGTAVVDGDPAPLNAGLFPAKASESHTIVFQDAAGTPASQTPVTLTSADITMTPVGTVGASGPFASTIPTASGTVGYLLFNDHNAPSEAQLVSAITQLRSAAVTDLVLDMRYNGGGFLDIASELAYMIAGGTSTTGKVFERLAFNAKTPEGQNPVTGGSNAPTPFHTTTQGFSPGARVFLPTLNLRLARVFVITSGNTCSASESVLNGLRGVGVAVNLIGGTTCGKPYGFYPQDNCGTTYFAIQFQGVNAAGFGDYADGFVPGGSGPSGAPGCVVADDFAHALGDPAEGRLAAALAFRATGQCPAPVAAATALVAPGRSDGRVVRPAWRENRIVRR